jgi:hypothetical protein
MSERDAPSHEMPGFNLPGWPGREPAEQLLDTILAGQPLPPGASRELQVVAEQLAGLASPAGPDRLPGEAAAVAAFSRAVSSGGPSPRRGGADRTRRLVLPRRGLPAIGRARLAAALAVAGLVMGTTAAAYAGALPASVQSIAHHVIDAPAARHAPRHAPARPHHESPRPQQSQPAPGQHKGHSHPHGKAKGHAKHQPSPPAKAGKAKAGKRGHKPKRHG